MIQIDSRGELDELFANHRSTWDSLTRGVPFRTSAWLAPWWNQFGTQAESEAVIARDSDGSIIGVLPLYRAPHESGRTLRMIGDGDACSDYVSVLADAKDASEIAFAMGRYLASISSDEQRGWDLLDIDGIVEGDEPMAALARGLKEGGVLLHAYSRMSVWRRERSESWEAHLKSHGKTQRRRMRRMSEKFDADGPLQKRVASTDAEVEALLTELIRLHQKRWNREGESGSYADPRLREFVLQAAKEFLERDQLYLSAMQIDNQVISAELNFVGEDRYLYSFSNGFDIDHADLEPGRINGVDTLMQIYRADLRGIDYMRGDESYKRRLASDSHRVIRLRAVAPSWYPKFRHAMWKTNFEVRQFIRKRAGRIPIDVMDLTATSS